MVCVKDLVGTGKCRSDALEEAGGPLWVGAGRALMAIGRTPRPWTQEQVGWEKFMPSPYSHLPITCSFS